MTATANMRKLSADRPGPWRLCRDRIHHDGGRRMRIDGALLAVCIERDGTVIERLEA